MRNMKNGFSALVRRFEYNRNKEGGAFIMLEMIMDRHLQFVLLGAVASIGLISKIITGVTLKKLVWAAANMGKSTHPLMRLIRANMSMRVW